MAVIRCNVCEEPISPYINMKYRGLCKLCAKEVDDGVDYDDTETSSISDEDWDEIARIEREEAIANEPYNLGEEVDPVDLELDEMEESTFANIARLEESVEDGSCGEEADDSFYSLVGNDALLDEDFDNFCNNLESDDDIYDEEGDDISDGDIDIYGDIDYAAENDYADDFDFMGESKEAVFADIRKNAQAMRESRALPGGNLDSKEKTEYENWLEKLHKNIDKNKSKEDDNWAPKLFNTDCADNGYHDWNGNPLKKPTDFAKNENKKK